MKPTQQKKSLRRKVTRSVACNYLLHLPRGYRQGKERWPLILFLHGMGERGDNLELVKAHGLAKFWRRRRIFHASLSRPSALQTLLDE